MQPFAIDVKGGGKASKIRKALLKSRQRKKDKIPLRMKGGRSLEGSIEVPVDVLLSIPKGKTVGNIFIGGKGAERRSIRGKGAKEAKVSTKQRRKRNKETKEARAEKATSLGQVVNMQGRVMKG